MAREPHFLRPEDMAKDEERTPVSARIPVRIKEILDKEAKRSKISISQIVESVLKSYVNWLESGKK